MNKHLIPLLLFLFCLMIPRPVEARLTLGVVSGPDAAAGELSATQAGALAALLTEKLQEEVVIKELSDTATLISWLDRFAMLDLAVLSAKDLKANPGKFLQIGPLDEQGEFNLVCRQGVEGDLPQRTASIMREPNFVPWKSIEAVVSPEKLGVQKSPPPVEPEPTSIGDLATNVELQHVPPMSPGRTWIPKEEQVYQDILAAEAPPLPTLLEVTPPAEPTAVAAPVSVPLPPPMPAAPAAPSEVVAQPLPQPLEAVEPSAILPLVEPPDVVPTVTEPATSPVEPVQPAMVETVKVPDATAQPADPVQVEAPPLPVVVAVTPPAELPAVTAPVSVPLPPPMPAAPAAPSEEVAHPLPQPLEVVEPSAILPVVEPPDVVSTVIEPATNPVEPVQSAIVETVKVPAATAQPAAPAQPAIPPLLIPAAATLPAELPAVAAPVSVPLPPPLPAAPAAPSEVVVHPLPQLFEAVEPSAALPVHEAPEIAPAVTGLLPIPVEPVQAAMVATTEVPVVTAQPAAPEQPEMPPLLIPVADVSEPLAGEPESLIATPLIPQIESGHDDYKELTAEEQRIIEEVMMPAETISSQESSGVNPVTVEKAAEAWSDEEFAAMLNKDLVAAVVAQPDIPQEFRPSGVPAVRPGRISQRTTVAENQLLLASVPEPRKNIVPPRPPNLLPEPEPEQGVVYVVPFVSLMVPTVVNSRVFDQFVDTLNQEGQALGLQFVILKEGIQAVSQQWLSIRKYVTGEIYAYVEDSGCCSTGLRTKARLAYYRDHQEVPAFGFEHPFKSFFDHDRSTIDIERAKLSDDIAATLANELLKVLQN